jgi:hypothetical protein
MPRCKGSGMHQLRLLRCRRHPAAANGGEASAGAAWMGSGISRRSPSYRWPRGLGTATLLGHSGRLRSKTCGHRHRWSYHRIAYTSSDFMKYLTSDSDFPIFSAARLGFVLNANGNHYMPRPKVGRPRISKSFAAPIVIARSHRVYGRGMAASVVSRNQL